jgi:exopolysaccharide biosynthesis polyprenyl glycosylphosphotransferase
VSSLAPIQPTSFRRLANTLPWPARQVPAQADDNQKRNLLIVGAGRSARELAAHLRRHSPNACVVRGFVDDRLPVAGDVRGRISDLPRVIRTQFIDEIVLAPPHDREIVRKVAREARRNRITVTVVPDLFGFAPQSISIGTLGNIPALRLYEERLPLWGLFIKRSIDVVVSVFSLLFLALPLFVIAAVIKADSPGPVFYRAFRIGKKGKTFVCYKLRTMIADADKLRDDLRRSNERQGPLFKIAADPRITRVGRILRRYSIDEIPQLWNVLRGDMSLVGPRPHPVDDYQRYEVEHLRRLNVAAGLTGLWQVTARHDPSFERNMELDLEYIERWNVWLDLKILFQTFFVVLRGSGV